MSTSIVLRIKAGSGSLVRVITAIRKIGLDYKGQQLEELPDASETQLTVNVSDVDVKEDEVSQTLQELDCVVAVEGIHSEQNSGSQKKGSNILDLPALRVSETYIERTVKAYPGFMSVVERVEGSLRKASDRDDQLFAFGAAVGSRLAANNPSFPVTDNLPELQEFLKNFLRPISTFEIDGSDLTSKVSLFTRRYFNNMDMVFGSEFERCLMMSGIIHGMTNHALPGSVVTEPECRSNGDAACRFHIKPAS